MEFDLDYFIENAYQKGLYSSIEEIEELTINSTTNIKGINDLKGLKKLRIGKMFNDEYDYPGFVDYSYIETMDNLEELFISDNVNIKSLNLSNLKKLKTLVITFNSNLQEIIGLEKLPNLEKLIIVGNKFDCIENMEAFFNNTVHTKVNVLGVEFYHRTIGIPQLYMQYKALFENKQTSLMFAENTSVGGLYFYSPSMINNIYKKSLKILLPIMDERVSDIDKVRYIYEYVISNVQYDRDGLSKRDDELYAHFFPKPFENDNRYREINSSYHAIQRKKAVCEGYSNMMNLLLGILGIRSETIVCKLKNDSASYLNHSANKILINDNWYYCDAQKEMDVNKLQYFCKSKQDFLETHSLSIKDLKTTVKDMKYETNITRNASR